MSEISVVMAAYNAEKYIMTAIESILNQSFTDFELIIVDDGSTDNTSFTIQTFNDKRIKYIKNRHDYINSLNIGLDAATGKYVARMDADDLMHIDRLKIEHTIMEEEPDITVCTSWISLFGEDFPGGTINPTVYGILKAPLIHLLERNILYNPTAMMRNSFIKRHKLRYEYYDYAEDYKWWVEMAKRGAVFYIESQPLVFHRISGTQASSKFTEIQKQTAIRIKREILDCLIRLNHEQYPNLSGILSELDKANKLNLMSDDETCKFFLKIFFLNKNILRTEINS